MVDSQISNIDPQPKSIFYLGRSDNRFYHATILRSRAILVLPTHREQQIRIKLNHQKNLPYHTPKSSFSLIVCGHTSDILPSSVTLRILIKKRQNFLKTQSKIFLLLITQNKYLVPNVAFFISLNLVVPSLPSMLRHRCIPATYTISSPPNTSIN